MKSILPPLPSFNPNAENVKKQHVYSARAISEFSREDGSVDVLLINQKKRIQIMPDNNLFCVDGVWSQRSEMNPAENNYHKLLPAIKDGSEYCDVTITRFYLLWRERAKYWGCKGEHYKSKSVQHLDRIGALFFTPRGGAEIDINLNMGLSMDVDGFKSVKWTRVHAGGKLNFLNSDSPIMNEDFMLLPITPRLTLYGGSERLSSDLIMPDDVVREQNKMLLNASKRHVFSSELENTGVL